MTGRAFPSAPFAFAYAFQQAKAGRVVRLGKVSGAWRVFVAPINSTVCAKSN